MSKKFSCIVAVCENRGIGINGDLPWKLKQELKYFSHTTKKVNDADKRNAVIMGRKTYFGVPESKRPLPERLNIVLTRNAAAYTFPPDVLVCGSLQEALHKLDSTDHGEHIENIWVVGGNSVYKEAMESDRCHRIYLTEIKKQFDCDAFFPEIPNSFMVIDNDPDTPSGVQEENGIQYVYKIYENKQQ
ncbi:dihydrofolate reductase [Anopheles arabiensis]|uniref:dihydrofolate reductase n=3 Tax=gambiae species complex TaxID=44542 RepID=Q7Q0L5_ANOGA|nr:dihydrofolate reductase [Anopheles arabiensis]EAA14339.3 AGAP010278-PA [Anopheles gambiae str. PEST]